MSVDTGTAEWSRNPDGSWAPRRTPASSSSGGTAGPPGPAGPTGATGATGATGPAGASASQVDDPTIFAAALGAATAYDQEFDGSGSALPAGWSWLNQGTSTYLERFGAGLIIPQAGAGVTIRGIMESAPALPFTMYAKIGSSRSESAGHVAGLMLYNSSSGKIVTWGPSLNGSFEYDHWNSVSSFSAASADAAYLPGPVVVYLKLTIDASGNIAYFRSPDGIAWLQSGTSTLASFLSSVTHIGFGMDIESSTIDQLACHWLRLR